MRNKTGKQNLQTVEACRRTEITGLLTSCSRDRACQADINRTNITVRVTTWTGFILRYWPVTHCQFIGRLSSARNDRRDSTSTLISWQDCRKSLNISRVGVASPVTPTRLLTPERRPKNGGGEMVGPVGLVGLVGLLGLVGLVLASLIYYFFLVFTFYFWYLSSFVFNSFLYWLEMPLLKNDIAIKESVFEDMKSWNRKNERKKEKI